MAESMEIVAPELPEEVEAVDEYVLAFEAINAAERNVAVFEALMANERMDDAAVKVKENCIYRLTRLHTEAKNVVEVISLMKKNSEFFGVIAKAKTAKIVRTILDMIAGIPDSIDIQIRFCEELINWCVEEKRTFLRQRVEARLISLLLAQRRLADALELANKLLVELKKLDDKQMLMEVHLSEARIYHSLENIPKAKASLVSSRTATNSIYVVPLLQAELDEMSGVLCCEDGDNSTAYSYFQEAYDAYDTAGASEPTAKRSAVRVLQYMVLSRVMANLIKDALSLFTSKAGLKHSGAALEAMNAITIAVQDRSLDNFNAAVERHSAHLRSDNLISHHLTVLYDRMYETNLLKIIHPFSCVEIARVAQIINLPVQQVERKLSQMILDHKFSGILDQGRGLLEVFDESTEDKCFTSGMQVIANLGEVVDALTARGKKHNKGE